MHSIFNYLIFFMPEINNSFQEVIVFCSSCEAFSFSIYLNIMYSISFIYQVLYIVKCIKIKCLPLQVILGTQYKHNFSEVGAIRESLGRSSRQGKQFLSRLGLYVRVVGEKETACKWKTFNGDLNEKWKQKGRIKDKAFFTFFFF